MRPGCRKSRSGRPGVLVPVFLLLMSPVFAQGPPAQPPATTTDPAAPATPAPPDPEDPPLPELRDMVLPTTEELLRGKPTDWIVMLDQHVLVVEPVAPRPDTVGKRKAEYEALQKVPVTQIPLDEKQRQLAQLQRISITLPDNREAEEYQLEIRYIQEIIYFETQILRRVSKLLDSGELLPAYDLLMFLERRHPGWPGFEELYQRFLFLEAGQLAEEGQYERAWISAAHLHRRQPDFLNLSRLFGRISTGSIEQAIAAEDFRQARHFLTRLRQFYPDHRVAQEWQATLMQQARETVASAQQAAARQEHRTAALDVDRAARIWPELPGLKEEHRKLIDRFQILRVGIIASSLPSGSYGFPLQAEVRHRGLCELLLFEPERVQDGLVRYRSRVVESWEPGDLGREIRFQLQTRRSDWETRAIVTSGDVRDALQPRMTAGKQEFDARLARDVRSLEIESPVEWTLRLSRIPLRTESRLRIPLPLTPENVAWSGDLAPQAGVSSLQQRFYRGEASDIASDTALFARTRPQVSDSDGWHIAEIRERTFGGWDDALQALMRNEIDYLPDAEWQDVPAFESDRRFMVVKSALPTTHLIQIHPESVLAGNASLRRALIHALDRRKILDTTILRNARPDNGRLVTGPFASTLSAYDTQLRHPGFDEIRAASLAATARRQLGGQLPTLRLAVPGDPVSARAIPTVIGQWKRVGITVEIVAPGSQERWDLAWRALCLVEPAEDLWSLLTPTGESDWQQLAGYPHWLRERLWELEQTIDIPTAHQLLHQIQAEFLHEARWLPLWELDHYHVCRRRINGIPARPLHPYQGIERWTLLSWYPTETP